MRLALIFLLFCLSANLFAQDYNIHSIPDSLVNNADAVTRYEERIFEIKSPGKAVEHERHIYTILNESADYLGGYKSRYNKFTDINYISATLYDARGKEIKRVKKKDMEDISGTGDESLMTDTRYKIYNFYYRTYPYTVDYEEEDEINGLLQMPYWVPQRINRASVQLTKYVIIAPMDYQVRYKPVNCSIQPVITVNSGKKIYTWDLKNLPAKTSEVMAPSWNKIVPYVMIAPSEFEAEGYKGNMSTWEAYSKFFYNLLKGRDLLPEDTRKKVHELTDNIRDPKEKISILYEYLQKNTRYISIQLGIGGFQPFDASYVATKRYGDCKALSNFMVALLKEAGIKGNSVFIKSGPYPGSIDTSFTCDPFDHAICCIPLKNDTVWLECTDQTLPTGYLSGFTADRYGLLIDEKGGKLVHTPRYGLADNVQVRRIRASVNEDGNLAASVFTTYKAIQQDGLEEIVSGLSKDKLMQYLKNVINLPTYDISRFEYTQDKKILPPVLNESLELTATNYAQISGRRLFVNPNIMNRSSDNLKPDEERKYGIQENYMHRDLDTVEIIVPVGYKPESIPQDMKIESKFGKYFTSTTVMPDKILYYRLREQYSGDFPAKDFAGLVKFYEEIYKADRSRVVLVKKE
jgi:hypothetical protein